MSPQADAQLTEQARKRLLAEFENLLGEEREIDAADRDALLRHFTDALNDPAILTAPPADADSVRESLRSTLELLQQNRVIGAGDSANLKRQFEEPLESESMQRAMEFAKRRSSEGEDKALEWLAGQAAAAKADATPQPLGQDAIPPHLAGSLQARRPRR